MLIPNMRYSLNSFIVLLIVITSALLVIHLLYTISMVLDKKEFKFTRKDKKRYNRKRKLIESSNLKEAKNKKIDN